MRNKIGIRPDQYPKKLRYIEEGCSNEPDPIFTLAQ